MYSYSCILPPLRCPVCCPRWGRPNSHAMRLPCISTEVFNEAPLHDRLDRSLEHLPTRFAIWPNRRSYALTRTMVIVHHTSPLDIMSAGGPARAEEPASLSSPDPARLWHCCWQCFWRARPRPRLLHMLPLVNRLQTQALVLDP